MHSLHHPSLLPASDHLSRRKFSSRPSCGFLLKQVRGDADSKQQWLCQAKLLTQLRQHTACAAQPQQDYSDQPAQLKLPDSKENADGDAANDNDANYDDEDDDYDQKMYDMWKNMPEDTNAPGLRRAQLSAAALARRNLSDNGRPEDTDAEEQGSAAGQQGDKRPDDQMTMPNRLLRTPENIEKARQIGGSSIVGRAKPFMVNDVRGVMRAFQPDDKRWDQYFQGARDHMLRLRPAIDMEVTEGKAAMQLLYTKSKTAELARQGVILVDLQTQLHGSFHGDMLWRFTAAPEAAAKAPPSAAVKPLSPRGPTGSLLSAQAANSKQATNGATDTTEASSRVQQRGAGHSTQAGGDLPFNKFRVKESVVIVDMKKRPIGSDGSDEAEEKDGIVTGTIVHVTRQYLDIVLDREASDDLKEFVDVCNTAPMGSPARFRLDKQEMETTSRRQLNALEQLGELQTIRRYLKPHPQSGDKPLPRDEVQKRFLAELNIKEILFGVAESAQAAAETSPVWAGEVMQDSRSRQAGAGFTEGDKPKWTHNVGYDVEHAQDLNTSQQLAVSKAILRRLTLWQGPPGTGKTRTLLAYIRAMVVHNPAGNAGYLPILACADTNAAVDNLVQGLLTPYTSPDHETQGPDGEPRRMKDRDPINVVRVGHTAKVGADVQHRCLGTLARETEEGKAAVELQQEAATLMEDVAKEANTTWDKLDKITQRAVRAKKKTLELSAKVLLENATEAVLRDAQVIAATCSGAGDERTLGGMQFRVVVIDEATQATEPSTLIPFVRGAESVVMAGDPQQLPPTVISMAAAEMGLQTTLFERLQTLGIKPLLLDQQYRMHPLIAQVPSELFYQGQLKSATSPEERRQPEGFPWPNPTFPVTLIPCDYGVEQTGHSSRVTAAVEAEKVGTAGGSYKNEAEAAIVIRALEILLDYGETAPQGEEEGSRTHVALLTPYNGQFRELQRRVYANQMLAEFAADGLLEVSSVDGYQGREANVVILSTVRCNEKRKLGFVNDYRRMNVAISRARRGLIVVGSPSTLQANYNWREWMQWVLSYRSILDPSVLDLPQYALKARSADKQQAKQKASDANTDTTAGHETRLRLIERKQKASKSAGAESKGKKLLVGSRRSGS